MKNRNSSIGDSVAARCTKCLKVTNHVVVTLAGSKPARVQCNTCSETHQYRQPVAIPKSAKQTSDSPDVKQAEWSELRETLSSSPATDYDMEKGYRTGTVIRHASLGIGLVQRINGNRKMEVLFECGKKLMRCK